MSTYQGRAHVEQQIESVLGQRGVDVRLVVRDDGSTDGTADLVAAWTARDPRVRLVEGANLGLPWAYFELLERSGHDADLWALADQDDVWLPDKLARAVSSLAGVPGPALACSRVLVSDERLAPLYPHPLPVRGPSLANALVQNVVTGCTAVLNPAARDVLRGRWPGYAVMHDAWLYLVVAAVGTVVYDAEVSVLYRQHLDNAVGMGRGRVDRVLGRVRRQLAPGGAGAHGRQDEQLLLTHGDVLPGPVLQVVQDFVGASGSLAGRVSYALRGPAHRQSWGSDLVLRALIAAGRA